MGIIKSHFPARFFWICVLSMSLLLVAHLWDAFQWNWIDIWLAKGQTVSIPDSSRSCYHNWFIGMAAGNRGDLSAQQDTFTRLLGCSSNYLTLMQIVLPENLELARLATQYYPENSRAWSWLGRASLLSDHFVSRQAYLRTVTLTPNDGFAWFELGWNYEQSDEFENAGRAYLKGCFNGDYNYFCCWSAGRMMEKQGDLEKAIQYYRLSKSEKSLERARQLEEQLKQ
jgi:tetratricopeptide (TPR) repeat protein